MSILRHLGASSAIYAQVNIEPLRRETTTMPEGSMPLPDETSAIGFSGWEQPADAYRIGELPTRYVPLRSTKLGRSAMTMAICVIGLSVAASVLIGLFGTTIYRYGGVTSTAGSAGFNAQPNLVAFGVQVLIGSTFGIWSLVQGIVATAQNRGRKFGIVAIVVAGAAPLVSVVIWTVVGLVARHSISQ